MSSEAAALPSARTAIATQRRPGLRTPVLGMLLFIASEVMFFAGLFGAYFTIRFAHTELVNGVAAHVWPPTPFVGLLNPWRLTTESGTPNVILPATVLLILSSVTCQIGVRAIARGDQRGFVRAISVTLALGAVFLGLQLYDYTDLVHEGLTVGGSTFGTTYFTLTGFHGAHVLAGALMLVIVLYRGRSGQFTARHHDMVEAVSLYWHFVDVVWVVLFSILYLT
ncbi:MAG TPA: cytochrome c oxidase subunit 3 [Candidatus Limnocylindrales bacterium]